MNQYKRKFATKRLMLITLLGTVGAFLMLWQIPYPGAPWLKFDLSDVSALIAGFAIGPFSGLLVLLVKSAVFLALKFDPAEIVGVPMNLISSGALVYFSAVIYHSKKTWRNACFGLFAGTVVSIFIMIPANYYILPLFMKWFIPAAPIPPSEKVIQMVMAFVIPYNALKDLLNGILTFLVYKRISKFLHE